MSFFFFFPLLEKSMPTQTTVSYQGDKQDKLVTWSLQELLLISSATVGTATSHCCLQWLTFLKVMKQQGN